MLQSKQNTRENFYVFGLIGYLGKLEIEFGFMQRK
jgi:hypothetical protein